MSNIHKTEVQWRTISLEDGLYKVTVELGNGIVQSLTLATLTGTESHDLPRDLYRLAALFDAAVQEVRQQ